MLFLALLPFVVASPTITVAPTHTGALVARATTYETTSPLPLTDYFYPYSAIPYQVNPYAIDRGPQSGYNICNSTTEGSDSQCQTAIFNSIEDFCFWGAPGTNQTISDEEAAVVAFCSRSGHGARIFPENTFQAIQFMKTDGYIQLVGFLDQTVIGLQSDDSGGELDPHGADLAGNPLGGLFYSTGFASGDNVTYVQTQSWNNFLGSGVFCLKLCDPSYSTDLNYCQNIYDIIGCEYNMPADYATLQSENLFISCEGDLQDEVGTYTSSGQTYTWSQPSSLPATSTLPWTPRIPASSNCVTYQSTDLFPSSSLGYAAGAAAITTVSPADAGSTSVSGSASRSSSSRSTSLAASTGTVATTTTTKTSGTTTLRASTGLIVWMTIAAWILYG